MNKLQILDSFLTTTLATRAVLTTDPPAQVTSVLRSLRDTRHLPTNHRWGFSVSANQRWVFTWSWYRLSQPRTTAETWSLVQTLLSPLSHFSLPDWTTNQRRELFCVDQSELRTHLKLIISYFFSSTQWPCSSDSSSQSLLSTQHPRTMPYINQSEISIQPSTNQRLVFNHKPIRSEYLPSTDWLFSWQLQPPDAWSSQWCFHDTQTLQTVWSTASQDPDQSEISIVLCQPIMTHLVLLVTGGKRNEIFNFAFSAWTDPATRNHWWRLLRGNKVKTCFPPTTLYDSLGVILDHVRCALPRDLFLRLVSCFLSQLWSSSSSSNFASNLFTFFLLVSCMNILNSFNSGWLGLIIGLVQHLSWPLKTKQRWVLSSKPIRDQHLPGERVCGALLILWKH